MKKERLERISDSSQILYSHIKADVHFVWLSDFFRAPEAECK